MNKPTINLIQWDYDTESDARRNYRRGSPGKRFVASSRTVDRIPSVHDH
jgi:hypothetical protein